MSDRDVLRKAKEVLLQRGWTNRGQFQEDNSERVCLLGAVGVALCDDAYYLTEHAEHPVVRTVAEQLPSAPRFDSQGVQNTDRAFMYDEFTDTVMDWNDSYAQSIDEVIAVLDRAIASLKLPEGVLA